MDSTGNRRRSVDAAMAQTAQPPTLNRSRSFKTKQLVRSQAIRETQSPPRLPSPRKPERASDNDHDDRTITAYIGDTATGAGGVQLERTTVQCGSDDGTKNLKADHSDTVYSGMNARVNESFCGSTNISSLENCDNVYSSQAETRTDGRTSVDHQVVIQVTSGDQYELSSTQAINHSYSESKPTSTDINKPRQRAKKWHMRQQPSSSEVYDEAVRSTCGKTCICGSCDYSNASRRRGPTPSCPSKQDSGVVCCSDDCPDCYYLRSIDTSNNEVEFESHCEPTGVDLARFIKDTLNKNLKDRMTLFKIERELIVFVNDAGRVRYQFPAMTSYGRMLVHRCAALFGLNHIVDNITKTSVIVSKTGITNIRIPCTPFRQWCTVSFPNGSHSQTLHQDSAAQTKSILKRDSHSLDEPLGPSVAAGQPPCANGPPTRSKSFEQREEEYERVRRRIFSAEESKSQDPNEWSWPAGTVKLLTPEANPRQSRLLKVQSLETDSGRIGNGGVSKSHSFGGYGAPTADPATAQMVASHQPRLLSRQGDLASSSWRLSPSSSGYKTLSFKSTDSITPSPTDDHTPEPSQELVASHAESLPALVWAVSDMSAIPHGALIIHPQTGRPITNPNGSVYRYDPARPPRLDDSDTGPRMCTPPDAVGIPQQDLTSLEKRRGRLEKQKSIIGNPDCNEYHEHCPENLQKPAEVICAACQALNADARNSVVVYKREGIRDRSVSPFNGSMKVESPARRPRESEKRRPCDQEGYCAACDVAGSKEQTCNCYRDCRQGSCGCVDCRRNDRERQPHEPETRVHNTNPQLMMPLVPRSSPTVYGTQNETGDIMKQHMVLASPEQYQAVHHQHGQAAAMAPYCPPYSPPSHVPYQYCDEQSLTFTYAHHQRSLPVHYPVEAVSPAVTPLVRGITQPNAGGRYLVNQTLTPYHQTTGLWPTTWTLCGPGGPTASAAPPAPTTLYTPVPAPSQPPTQAANIAKHHPVHGLYLQQPDFSILPTPYAGIPAPQLYQPPPSLVAVPNLYAAHNYGAHVLTAAAQPYGAYPGYAYPQNTIGACHDDRSSVPPSPYEQSVTPTVPLAVLRRDFDNGIGEHARNVVSEDGRTKLNPSNPGSEPQTPHAQLNPQFMYPNQPLYPNPDSYNKPQTYFQFPNTSRLPEYPPADNSDSQQSQEARKPKCCDEQIRSSGDERPNDFTNPPPLGLEQPEQGNEYYQPAQPAQQQIQNATAKATDKVATDSTVADSQIQNKDVDTPKSITSNLNAECKNFVPKSSKPDDSTQDDTASEAARNPKRYQERQVPRAPCVGSPRHGGRQQFGRRLPDQQQRDFRGNASGQGAGSPVSNAASAGSNQSCATPIGNSGSPANADPARRPAQSPRFNRTRTFDGDRMEQRNWSENMRRNNTPPARQGLIPFNPRMFGDGGVPCPGSQFGPGFRPRGPQHPSLVAQQMQAMGLYPRPAFLFARQMSANTGMWNRRSSGDAGNQGVGSQMYRQPRGQRPPTDQQQCGPRTGQHGRQGNYGQRR